MKSKIKCEFQDSVEELFKKEINYSNLSKTNNKLFEENGFLFLKDFLNVEKYTKNQIPKERGTFLFIGLENYYNGEELQVNGSLSKYNDPIFKELQNLIRIKVEKIIGKKLYNTYYYDRFYFPGQELKVHTDRPSCEISVSLHLKTNLKCPWEIGIKTPIKFFKENENIIVECFGKEVYFNFNPGDALLYKGIERPHWRNPMPGRKTNFIRKIFKRDELYYHQIFFHYVLSDGLYAEYAFDNLS